MAKLILASASPRRQVLLSQLGLDFEVQVSEVVEDSLDSCLPCEPINTAKKLAFKKAFCIAGRNDAGVVLGADTIVLLNEQILGKPADAKEAKRMLIQLSGKTHKVITGLALIDACTGKQRTTHSVTKVLFKELNDRIIDAYVATGEPLDKAGAYGIQGLGACLVEGIRGCYFNVVGLPIAKLVDLLPLFGIEIFGGDTL